METKGNRNVPHPNAAARNRAYKRLELEFAARFQQIFDEEKAKKPSAPEATPVQAEQKTEGAQA